jgi:hypothetical protein
MGRKDLFFSGDTRRLSSQRMQRMQRRAAFVRSHHRPPASTHTSPPNNGQTLPQISRSEIPETAAESIGTRQQQYTTTELPELPWSMSEGIFQGKKDRQQQQQQQQQSLIDSAGETAQRLQTSESSSSSRASVGALLVEAYGKIVPKQRGFPANKVLFEYAKFLVSPFLINYFILFCPDDRESLPLLFFHPLQPFLGQLTGRKEEQTNRKGGIRPTRRPRTRVSWQSTYVGPSVYTLPSRYLTESSGTWSNSSVTSNPSDPLHKLVVWSGLI